MGIRHQHFPAVLILREFINGQTIPISPMVGYSLRGRIRDAHRKGLKGLHILAFDDDLFLNPDDLLGDART
ncbi:MAG: hypothetical protein ACE5MG_13415, partial [Candidatus Methylomirabilales bacterium]